MELKYFTNTTDGNTWINKDTLIKKVKQMAEWSIPSAHQKDFYELFFEFMDECKYKD